MTRNVMSPGSQAVLSPRLREVREDLYGEHGAQFLADTLHIPLRTWLNYEVGVTVPAAVVLRLIDMAHVNPRWLLTGEGNKYDRRSITASSTETRSSFAEGEMDGIIGNPSNARTTENAFSDTPSMRT
jgi:hypothetical protein